MCGITDIGTFILDNEGKVFRFWVYKKIFTPYEQRMQFVDESVFMNTYRRLGLIEEGVELPDGDVLLGIRVINEGIPDEDIIHIEYHKLSEIKLEWCGEENKIIN